MKSHWHPPWGGILAALAVVSCSQQDTTFPNRLRPAARTRLDGFDGECAGHSCKPG